MILLAADRRSIRPFRGAVIGAQHDRKYQAGLAAGEGMSGLFYLVESSIGRRQKINRRESADTHIGKFHPPDSLLLRQPGACNRGGRLGGRIIELRSLGNAVADVNDIQFLRLGKNLRPGYQK